MIERLPNGTYEIAIQRRYSAVNFTEYPGQLSFHCHLLVLMTSWRSGLKYKLFGEAGCVKLPPAIDNATMAIFGERTCWGTPRENSRVSYNCAPGYEIVGPHVLVCRNGSWLPDPVSQMNQPVSQMKELQLRMPYCGIRKCILSFSLFNQSTFFTINPYISPSLISGYSSSATRNFSFLYTGILLPHFLQLLLFESLYCTVFSALYKLF